MMRTVEISVTGCSCTVGSFSGSMGCKVNIIASGTVGASSNYMVTLHKFSNSSIYITLVVVILSEGYKLKANI